VTLFRRRLARGLRRGGVGALAVLVVVLTGASAVATTVAIVEPAESSPWLEEVMVRLQGELDSVGYVTARLPSEAERPSPPVDARVTFEGGVQPSAVVVSFEGPRGTSGSRRLALEPDNPLPSRTLAIRALELVRATLAEADLAPREAPAVTGEASAWRLGAEAGALALLVPGGAGPSLSPLVRAQTLWRETLMIEATWAGAGTTPSVEDDVGRAQISQSLLVVGVGWRFPWRAALHPFVSLAVGVLRTAVAAEAVLSSYEAHGARQWSALAVVGGGLELGLGKAIFARGTADLEVARPYPVVRFGGEDVASLGRPAFGVSLSLGARL